MKQQVSQTLVFKEWKQKHIPFTRLVFDLKKQRGLDIFDEAGAILVVSFFGGAAAALRVIGGGDLTVGCEETSSAAGFLLSLKGVLICFDFGDKEEKAVMSLLLVVAKSVSLFHRSTSHFTRFRRSEPGTPSSSG